MQFENFTLEYTPNGNTINVPIKYTCDKYTLLRGSGKLHRGDESEWTDAEWRPRLIKRLRHRLRRLREAREGHQSAVDAKLADLWERAYDVQPFVYRQMVLEQLSTGTDVVEVPEHWMSAINAKAIQEAKDLFHTVYPMSGRMPLMEGESSPVQPTYELSSSRGKVIRNPTRSSPGRYKLDASETSKAGARTEAGNANVDANESQPRSQRATLSPARARPTTLLADTGASNHTCNLDMLTDEDKKRIRPMAPVVLNTANGPMVCDSYIEIELTKLGAARPLRFHIAENSPNLLSVGQLVLEDGFRFYWEGKRANLVSPKGHHTWLTTMWNTPEFTTRDLVVNKINEIEGQALVAAKSRRIAKDGSTENIGKEAPFNQTGIPDG